ncbi:MAG: siphovirus Gp157 family protein [Lachnospiraceae bacterium]|nr:siphovirus Gp157 family protein [Lachnospiraceae bacterium]MCM1230027.1 siphovirus Gp157 family protein [Ruminococcus flavefaciens]
MNLYEIDTAITACVDEETGEIIDLERLNELLMERDTKIEKVALWIKNLDSDAAAIKAERDALDKRMKSAENRAKSLREWLKNALECQPFETARVRVSFRKSEQTEVDESVLDRKWCKEKVTYTPDKTAIKNAIKAGQTVDGARIVINQNIQIK